jgi:hypothetical protein
VRFTLLVVAIMLATSAPASAHWQNTKWEMNEAEVRALWPSAVEKTEGDHFALVIDGPVTISGVTYNWVRFSFDTKGRLKVVRLEALRSFDEIADSLSVQMGPPVTKEDRPFFGGLVPGGESMRSKSALFRDLSKGNAVKIYGVTGRSTGPSTTTLTYRTVETGF